MSSEEKIRDLTERVEALEKAENRRKMKKTIGLVWGLIKLGAFIALIIICYNYIKPYKEKIDQASEKVESVENFINDKFGGLSKYFK